MSNEEGNRKVKRIVGNLPSKPDERGLFHLHTHSKGGLDHNRHMKDGKRGRFNSKTGRVEYEA